MSSHVITRKFTRRATSVPVEPISVIETNGASTARRISNAALDDTAAIMAQSKRHDRQLIEDINARMASQSLPVGASVRRTKPSLHRPPLPPSVRSFSTVNSFSTTLPSRRFTSRNLNNDDDVILGMPPIPITKSVIRASSLPPNRPLRQQQQQQQQQVPVTSTRITSYYQPTTVNGLLSSVTSPYWTNYYLTDYEDADDVKLGYVPTRVTSPPGQVSPVADLAIRQAHRNLDRIEKELKHPANSSSNSNNYFQTQPYADEYQRRAPTRVTWNPVVDSVRYRRSSLSPVSSYHHRRTSPVRPSELISFASSSSAAPSSGAGFERRAVTSPKPRADLEHRHYRSQSQQPISSQRQLLSSESDHILKNGRPLYIIAGSGSDDKKASAKHYIDSVSNAFKHPAEKPKISEARRKVRDVLCKVKNDPHYFD